ncbi:hypothetical protein [Proteus terrae]|uniref:hypothetical protein n=1 Tax=Proteus terrae TaxID=1574161 RepID=UPI00288A4E94|nr:hypothetical protein [Proteus terrae]
MIAISISTTKDRLFNIKKDQFPNHKNINYFISIQGLNINIEKNKIEKFIEKNFPYFHILYTETTGLSNNRNNSLRTLYTLDNIEYIYIADDDIHIKTEEILHLARKMKQDDVSLGCGKISSGINEFKNYLPKETYYNILTAARISSVEILLNRKFMASHNIFFDITFGLGGTFDSGEEYVFCSDIIKAKGLIKYYPIVLCKHPPISSGKGFYLTPEKIAAKGAMFYRVFGYKSLFFSLVFSLKKYTIYKNKLNLIQFYLYMLSGIKSFKKHTKKTF